MSIDFSILKLSDTDQVKPQVTYEHSLVDALRKPATISVGVLSLFVAAWLIGKIDVSIKKR